MDHVIEYILDYMECDVKTFQEEWTSGNYSKILDCPSYETIKSYCDAIKALNRMDGSFTGCTPMYFIKQLEQ
ncbi:hypothetical protein D7V86_15080 [bacterium D16-51]|nr:hypothetical protein D7V96_20495 [bacterium D16-59]RKI58748.1 hypothetical protein D7V86_15080 [bacterium D16-51]